MSKQNVILALSDDLLREAFKGIVNSVTELEVVFNATTNAELSPGIIQKAHIIVTDQHFGVNQSPVRAHSTESLAWMVVVDNPKLFDVSAWNMPVKAFITRDCSLEEIQYAIHSLRNGKKFFCEKLLDALSPDSNNARIDINKREYEVLQKITQGKQTAEIAEELFLSTHTINTYRKRLLRKFDVRTPVELVVKSIKEGFIHL